MGVVLTIDRLARERQTARDQNKRFVFTNGCFDLFHRGHVEILKAAKGLGDLLCVAVNSDQSIRRLKGPRRPIVPEADRAAVVAALESVDFVTLFDEDTPRSVIARLRPDVLVKGADYGIDEIVGRSEVEEAGGIVVRIPLYGGLSTENLLKEIARRYRDLVD